MSVPISIPSFSRYFLMDTCHQLYTRITSYMRIYIDNIYLLLLVTEDHFIYIE